MQHSPLMFFCDECGLANNLAASHCTGCQHQLTRGGNTPPITPVTVRPQPVLEVRPGPLFDGQSARVAPFPSLACDFRPGSILAGRYQIQAEIGQGGFSTVYRALDQFTSRQVAIKRIQLSQLSPRQTLDATETFYREITLLPRFNNVTDIPAYYEHLADAENWYLITQYIEGQTLEMYLQKTSGGYLKEKEVLELGIGLASVLHILHTSEPPVIFRDLKPANIMLTPNHTFFLIDFGIARTFTPGKAKDTTPLGSPGYAPPEQYGRTQTDQRSDIYSLGATLQTLLTGRDPLELRDGEASRNPGKPSRGLRKLLDEMLSPEVARRPVTMLQVKKRLEWTQNRPGAIYMLGLVYGIILCSFAQIPPFLLFGYPSKNWIMYIAMLAAVPVEYFMQKKLGLPQKLPKGFKRFWLLGILTALLPFLLWSFIFQSLF